MHDLWEGVAQHYVASILYDFIYVKKYFSSRHLNKRIMALNYQNFEQKPSETQKVNLKTSKKLKMSAAETMTLVRNLRFIIADLILEDDSCWELFLSLNKMSGVIMGEVIDSDSPDYLAFLVGTYLEKLCKLFPDGMKNKHHHLVHYPRVMRFMGSHWALCSMRFESRHKEGKTISGNALCRINVCHTIAIKMQLKLNYRFLCENNFRPIWTYGPSNLVSVSEIQSYSDFKNVLPTSLSNDVQQLTWVLYYQKKITVYTFFIEHSREEPFFYKIKFIFLDSNNGLFFLAHTR